MLEILGQTYSLEPGKTYLVGAFTQPTQNDTKQTIALKNQSLDDKHAVIRVSNNETYICDLCSEYGTFLDGVHLEPLTESKVYCTRSIKFGNAVGRIYVTANELVGSSIPGCQSFTIPETQQCAPNNFNSDDEDEICIPESPEENKTNETIDFLQKSNLSKPPIVTDSEPIDESQFRICTQDFNEIDAHDNDSCDLLDGFQSSLIIPLIKHDALMDDSNVKANCDIQPEIVEFDNLLTTPRSVTTELRDESCTPDLVDVPDCQHKDKPKLNSIQLDPPVIDEDDLMPTQVFHPRQQLFQRETSPVFLTLSDKENVRPTVVMVDSCKNVQETQVFGLNVASTSSGNVTGKPHFYVDQRDDDDDDLLAATQVFSFKKTTSTKSPQQCINNPPAFHSTLLQQDDENKQQVCNASIMAEETQSKDVLPTNRKTSDTSPFSQSSQLDLQLCTPQFIKDGIIVGDGKNAFNSSLRKVSLFDSDSDEDEALIKYMRAPKDPDQFAFLVPHLKHPNKKIVKNDSELQQEQQYIEQNSTASSSDEKNLQTKEKKNEDKSKKNKTGTIRKETAKELKSQLAESVASQKKTKGEENSMKNLTESDCKAADPNSKTYQETLKSKQKTTEKKGRFEKSLAEAVVKSNSQREGSKQEHLTTDLLQNGTRKRKANDCENDKEGKLNKTLGEPVIQSNSPPRGSKSKHPKTELLKSCAEESKIQGNRVKPIEKTSHQQEGSKPNTSKTELSKRSASKSKVSELNTTKQLEESKPEESIETTATKSNQSKSQPDESKSKQPKTELLKSGAEVSKMEKSRVESVDKSKSQQKTTKLDHSESELAKSKRRGNERNITKQTKKNKHEKSLEETATKSITPLEELKSKHLKTESRKRGAEVSKMEKSSVESVVKSKEQQESTKKYHSESDLLKTRTSKRKIDETSNAKGSERRKPDKSLEATATKSNSQPDEFKSKNPKTDSLKSGAEVSKIEKYRVESVVKSKSQQEATKLDHSEAELLRTRTSKRKIDELNITKQSEKRKDNKSFEKTGTKSNSQPEESKSETLKLELPPRRMTRLRSQMDEQHNHSMENTKRTAKETNPSKVVLKSGCRTVSSSSAADAHSSNENRQPRQLEIPGSSEKSNSTRLRRKSDFSLAALSASKKTNEKAEAVPQNLNSSQLKILSTMVDADRIQSFVQNSNGMWSITSQPTECDILIMDEGVRTFKFLVAVARGIPIMNSKWLEIFNRTGKLEKMSEYFFNDAAFEKRYKFRLIKTLELARTQKLFAGIDFMLTSGIQPQPKDMKVIIECAGGLVHEETPTATAKKDRKLYLVSTKRDAKDWHGHRRTNKHIRIISGEGVISAVLKQSLRSLDECALA